MPIREISRRTGLSRNTIRKYLREGVVGPKFKARLGRASWTLMRTGCQPGCWRKRGSHARSHILETGNDSYRFKASFEAAKNERKETPTLTTT